MPKCNYFHNHICIDINGRYTPCCIFSTEEHFDIEKYSYSEYKNLKFYKKLIDSYEKDYWINECKECKISESMLNSESSHRQTSLNKCSGIPNRIEFIELSLSNFCNLSCIMCNSKSSTKWNKLVKENLKLKKFHQESSVYELNFKKVLDDIDLTYLKNIKILGGEPFIMPQTVELIKYLKKRLIKDQVCLEFSSNVTRINRKIFEYSNFFNEVKICVSIDAIGKLNNFIRYGSQWDNILQNLQYLQSIKDSKKIKLILTPSIGALNLHHFVKLENFAEENAMAFSPHLIYYPRYLHYNSLPEEYIQEIFQKSTFKFKKNFRKVFQTEGYQFSKGDFYMLKKYITTFCTSLNIDIQEYDENLFSLLQNDY